MGAWIEMEQGIQVHTENCVAPHMGAWIEIKSIPIDFATGPVAPHMGAWIEIQYLYDTNLPL